MGPVPRGLPTSPPGGDGGLVAHPGRRTPRATSTDPAPPGRVRLPAGPGGRSGQGSRARATLRCRRIRRTTPSPRLPRSPQRSVHQPVAPRSRIRRSSREWRGERTPGSAAGSDVRHRDHRHAAALDRGTEELVSLQSAGELHEDVSGPGRRLGRARASVVRSRGAFVPTTSGRGVGRCGRSITHPLPEASARKETVTSSGSQWMVQAHLEPPVSTMLLARSTPRKADRATPEAPAGPSS